MHKIGLALTAALGIAGLWDYKAFWENETVQEIWLPVLGLAFFATFMRYALNRA